MDEDLKEMEFSIICKDGDVTVRLNGSIIKIAALIATTAVSSRDVEKIIKLAVIGLNAKEKANK
jgi:hypothetical protein